MKQIKNILYGVILLLVVALVYSFINLDKYKSDYYRYKSNYDVMKYHYGKLRAELNDRQIYITQRDLHLMYANLLQKIKEYGIKEKHVDNVISYTYRIKDTSFVNVIYDTINDNKKIIMDKDCYHLQVEMTKDTAKVNIDIKDTFDIVLYRKINKDVSWFKRLFNKNLRYHNYVLIYSHCKGDTIMSTTNIKIIE